MSDTIKGAIIGAVITGIFSIVVLLLGNVSVEKRIVQTLSDRYEFVDKEMSYEQALEVLDKDIKRLEKDKEDAEQEKKDKEYEIESLRESISIMPKVEYNSIGIVMNGQRTEDEIKNGWASIDGRNYYSEDIVNSLLEKKIYLDNDNKTLFYDAKGTGNPRETRVSLEDSNTLFDGYNYRYYKSNEAETFSLGSSSYNSGFTLNNHTWEGNAYALFDLKSRYSKIIFDVGKVTGADNYDATMRVYLDNNFSEEVVLSSSIASRHIEIDLKHSDNLMIEVLTDNVYRTSIYGFANVVLEY